MNLKLIDTINMPEYAICAIENDDYSGLENDDIKEIKDFLSGFTSPITFNYLEEEGNFCTSPEFGLPCNCIKTEIYI